MSNTFLRLLPFLLPWVILVLVFVSMCLLHEDVDEYFEWFFIGNIMLLIIALAIFVFVKLVEGAPHSYQYVKFFKVDHPSRPHIPLPPPSWDHHHEEIEIEDFDIFNTFNSWNEEFFPHHKLIDLGEEFQIPEHTNDLENSDPLLLTGPQAKRLVYYLYQKGLFYNDIPHQKLLYMNQHFRRLNGLKENKFGSLSPSSPFYRRESSRGFF